MNILELNKKDIFQIRPMWEKLNEWHGHLSTHFKDHFKTFSFEERIKQIENKKSFAIFVAQTEQELVGYCITSIESETGEIDSIYVNPEYRQKKIGERLLLKAESWLKSKHVVKYQISVVQGNESVFEFYSRQGYHPKCTVLEKKT